MRENLISCIQTNVDDLLGHEWYLKNTLIFVFLVAKKKRLSCIIFFYRLCQGSQIVPRTPLALLPLGEKDKEDVLLRFVEIYCNLVLRFVFMMTLTFTFYGDLNVSPHISLQNMYHD